MSIQNKQANCDADSFPIVFKTTKARAAGDLLIVFLMGILFFLFGLLVIGVGFAFGLRESERSVLSLLVIAGMVLIPLALFILFCFWASARLNSTLEIQADELAFCNEVVEPDEVISITELREGQYGKNVGLEISGEGFRWRCYIGEHSQECLQLLLGLCKHAIMVDSCGNTYVNKQTKDSYTTQKNLVKTTRRQAKKLFFGGIIGLFLCLPAWGLIYKLVEGESVSPWDYVWFLTPIITILLFYKFIERFREARAISKSLKKQMVRGISPPEESSDQEQRPFSEEKRFGDEFNEA